MSQNFKFSQEAKEKINSELKRYEIRESAIIPALFIAQNENGGWISDGVIQALSGLMDIPTARINEVFKFYTMFNQKPVGKYHVQVCTNISCALNGGRELSDYLCKELKTTTGEVTEDGRFCVSRVECLGSCSTAPMMQVNEQYHENLTPETAMNILRGLK
jgi:NADH-quinone oxidoreductase subunit E